MPVNSLLLATGATASDFDYLSRGVGVSKLTCNRREGVMERVYRPGTAGTETGIFAT